jgi:hypothetical protein
MNDFTKEELEAIHYDLVRNKNPWQCGETIINKIQTMIDNYCEHSNASIDICEHTREGYSYMDTVDGELKIKNKCAKCGKFYSYYDNPLTGEIDPKCRHTWIECSDNYMFCDNCGKTFIR